jgi:DNA invertase Pin-like site-specific DNA recombinase
LGVEQQDRRGGPAAQRAGAVSEDVAEQGHAIAFRQRRGAGGRAMFGMLSVLAELQRELTLANTHDGLAAARARGRVGGRRPKLSPEQAAPAQQQYDAGEKTVQQIADLFGVPRSTVYGYLDRFAGDAATAAQARADDLARRVQALRHRDGPVLSRA